MPVARQEASLLKVPDLCQGQIAELFYFYIEKLRISNDTVADQGLMLSQRPNTNDRLGSRKFSDRLGGAKFSFDRNGNLMQGNPLLQLSS